MFSFNKKYYSQRKKKQNIISNNDSTQVILTNGYISIQTTQLYDFCWKRFHRTVFKTGKVLKGATPSMDQQLRNFQPLISTSSFTFSLVLRMPLHCLFKDLQIGGEVPFVVFLIHCSYSLGPWSHREAFWKVLKMRLAKTGKTALDRFWEVWKLRRNISVKTWGLQNRSEPFWRSAEPFWTVLETFAPRKLARKFVLCAKNPGSRKARTRLNHSGCSCPSLKVTHHHPQEPDR